MPGLCECGCGGATQIARVTNKRKGWTKGQPKRYICGHSGGRERRGYIVDEASGCWNFAGHISRIGRAGSVRLTLADGSSKFVSAYRYYYEQARGPIPSGLVLDHVCRNPRCVNPAHLEPVTQAENLRRGRVARGVEGGVS